MKFESPSISKTSFNCPHCQVLSTQFWHSVGVSRPYGGKNHAPNFPTTEQLKDAKSATPLRNKEEEAKRLNKIRYAERLIGPNPFLQDRDYSFCHTELGNVYVSECFECKRLSLWIHDVLYYPSRVDVPPANPDIPDDIRKDYGEAAKILGHSPRGSAALLRLAVQKLCKELGGKGENINHDIAYLVKNGLHPKIQKALDSVRIIGNEAVHSGQMDLRDDRETAELLFGLINIIADNMISSVKRVNDVWEKLPENKKLQTQKRDSK